MVKKMPVKKFITGNEAVAQAARLAHVDVVAAYPITPQTGIVEKIAEYIAKGEMDADYIKVESEHSALTACMGVRMAGARAFTSTSSQGLEYMHEMLAYAAGGRYPLVLANVCRSVALPWSIWGDQQDAIQHGYRLDSDFHRDWPGDAGHGAPGIPYRRGPPCAAAGYGLPRLLYPVAYRGAC